MVRFGEVSQRPFRLDVDQGSGGGKYEIAGSLSIKGCAKACVVPVTIRTDAAGNRVAEGKFSLKRLDYRVGEGMWADTDTVANDVIVSVRIVLPPG